MRKTERQFKSAGSILSLDQIEEARSLRSGGHSFREIGRGMKVDSETVQRALDPKFRAKRAEQIALAKMRLAASDIKIVRHTELRFAVPVDRIVDRDLRSNALRSLTSLFCGDPPPGYSALDRR